MSVKVIVVMVVVSCEQESLNEEGCNLIRSAGAASRLH